MMRLRWVVQVVLATLLATTLAGCSSAPAETEAPTGEVKYGIRSAYVDADNETHGLVVGVVLNEAGEPVPDARVMILSVDGSATSDSAGKFNFTDVAKGEQSLRVEKPGYKTLQRPFSVAAGKIVELEVVLARVDGLRGGAIEHFHDKWRGQELYTIYEGRIELDDDVTRISDVIFRPLHLAPGAVGLTTDEYPIVLEEGQIVPPGTARITIDISYEPSPMSDQETRLFYIYPPPGPSGTTYDSEHWSLESGGEHLEYTLPSSEITDHGHATYTNWGFALSISNPTRTSPEAYNMLFPRPVDITITAHKGDVAIDPPHPKYWANTDRTEMPTGPETQAYCTVAGAVDWNCLSRSPNPTVSFGSHDEPRRCLPHDLKHLNYGGCMVLDRGGLVPPGATGISFDLELWQSAGPTEPPAGLVDNDWVLGFKTAAPPRGGATWDDYTWVEPVEAFEPEPQQGRYHQQGLRYVIDVPEGGADPYYTVHSGWVFMMAVRGHETASDWSDISCGYYPCGEPYFQMKNFFVYNDAKVSGTESA